MASSLLPVLFLIIAVSSVVYCRRTHCERWKGDSQFRCAKDNFQADSVHIENVANQNVTFKISKWKSICGTPGGKYSVREWMYGPGRSIDVKFKAAECNICHEMFLFDCKVNGKGVNCLEAVLPTPNLPK